ncbi:DUF3617 domain-containing protein [Methylocystis sp. MitZ-2018]|uniref:DUF3617 domain-containing protein n=2 Tax=Methylosinus sporium TaxID=428 RepID=UPI000D5A1ECF|nr:hypothetical protein C5688_16355 [Methylocystis sp. MitZ-2018]
MKTISASTVFALAIPMGGSSAAESSLLQSGRYEVAVALELPHLVDAAARKTATICIDPDNTPSYGLEALSDSNPLANCSPRNSRLVDKTLTFDIVCAGPDAARALATYRFTSDRQVFGGQIAMTMGGKNMTMTETQLGRRIGDCIASDVPRR